MKKFSDEWWEHVLIGNPVGRLFTSLVMLAGGWFGIVLFYAIFDK